MENSKKIVSAWGIFIGLFVGACIGLVFNSLKEQNLLINQVTWITDNLFYPIGNAFLQSLFMVVVPLVFSSLIVGVADLGAGQRIGRLGKKLFLFYAFSTIIASSIGQFFINITAPGKQIDRATVERVAVSMKDKLSSLKEKSSFVEKSVWPGIVSKIIPRNIIDEFGKNNMLAVIFVSLLFGMALLKLPATNSRTSFIQFMQALSDISVMVINWIMKLAPIAVASLLAIAFSELGFSLMKSMLFYVLVMLAGMLTHFFITYGCFVRFLVKMSYKDFLRKMLPVFSTAFGTSSSSATMPITMQNLEQQFGVPRSIVNFSVPIGTVVNMDGTALFEIIATVFLAQVFGVEMTLASHFFLLFVVFITSVGVASVPGGSLPILMSAVVVLGIPPEGIAIILGVDRLLDMGRTVVNVTGDSIAALYLKKSESLRSSEYSN